MSGFDYMEFIGGDNRELVFHANKYSKQECVEIFLKEYSELNKKCSEVDLETANVIYYPKTPEDLQGEFGEGGIYTFCESKRGSFPVYVLNIDLLQDKEVSE